MTLSLLNMLVLNRGSDIKFIKDVMVHFHSEFGIKIIIFATVPDHPIHICSSVSSNLLGFFLGEIRYGVKWWDRETREKDDATKCEIYIGQLHVHRHHAALTEATNVHFRAVVANQPLLMLN
jgi:hypothetical protein